MFRHHDCWGRESEDEWRDSQLEQGEVGVAVICAVFALLRHVVLEHRSRLGIVAIEPVQYCVDVLGPIWRVVKWDAHDECVVGNWAGW